MVPYSLTDVGSCEVACPAVVFGNAELVGGLGDDEVRAVDVFGEGDGADAESDAAAGGHGTVGGEHVVGFEVVAAADEKQGGEECERSQDHGKVGAVSVCRAEIWEWGFQWSPCRR